MYFDSPFLKVFHSCERENQGSCFWVQMSSVCLWLWLGPSGFHSLHVLSCSHLFRTQHQEKLHSPSTWFYLSQNCGRDTGRSWFIPVVMYKDAPDRKPKDRKFPFQRSSWLLLIFLLSSRHTWFVGLTVAVSFSGSFYRSNTGQLLQGHFK